MMRYTVIFSRNALKDLEEARSWYNLQQKGLGKRMIDDVKNVIAAIKQNPYFASVKFEISERLPATLFLMLFIMKLMRQIIVFALSLYSTLVDDRIGWMSKINCVMEREEHISRICFSLSTSRCAGTNT